MNTSSRVPGLSRNSGWRAIDATIAARRLYQQGNETVYVAAQGSREVTLSSDLASLGNDRP